MFAEKLKELRELSGYTQIQAADIVGISGPSYAAYESGKSKPTFDNLIKYADHYKVSLDWLCGRSEEKEICNPCNKVRNFEDLMIVLKSLSQVTPFFIDKVERCDGNYSALFFLNRDVDRFLGEFWRMSNLYLENVIDGDLLNLWGERQIENSKNIDISNARGEVRDVPKRPRRTHGKQGQE